MSNPDPHADGTAIDSVVNEWRNHTKDFWSAVRKQDSGVIEQIGDSDGNNFESASALAKAISCATSIRTQLKETRGGTNAMLKEWDASLDSFQANIKHTIRDIEAKLDYWEEDLLGVHQRGYEEKVGLQPSLQNVKTICSYAQKICYTSFAPPGYKVGDPLRLFRPPCPQEQQLSSSQLYPFAEKLHGMAQNVAKSSNKDARTQDPSSSVLPVLTMQESSVVSTTPPRDPPQASEQTHKDSIAVEMESLRKGNEDEGQGFDFILNPDLDPVDDDESSEEFSDDEW